MINGSAGVLRWQGQEHSGKGWCRAWRRCWSGTVKARIPFILSASKDGPASVRTVLTMFLPDQYALAGGRELARAARCPPVLTIRTPGAACAIAAGARTSTRLQLLCC